MHHLHTSLAPPKIVGFFVTALGGTWTNPLWTSVKQSTRQKIPSEAKKFLFSIMYSTIQKLAFARILDSLRGSLLQGSSLQGSSLQGSSFHCQDPRCKDPQDEDPTRILNGIVAFLCMNITYFLKQSHHATKLRIVLRRVYLGFPGSPILSI